MTPCFRTLHGDLMHHLCLNIASSQTRRASQRLASEFESKLKQFRESRQERRDAGNVHFQSIVLSDQVGDVDIACRRDGEGFLVEITALMHPDKVPLGTALLHWGVLHDFRNRSWHCPPEAF